MFETNYETDISTCHIYKAGFASTSTGKHLLIAITTSSSGNIYYLFCIVRQSTTQKRYNRQKTSCIQIQQSCTFLCCYAVCQRGIAEKRTACKRTFIGSFHNEIHTSHSAMHHTSSQTKSLYSSCMVNPHLLNWGGKSTHRAV